MGIWGLFRFEHHLAPNIAGGDGAGVGNSSGMGGGNDTSSNEGDSAGGMAGGMSGMGGGSGETDYGSDYENDGMGVMQNNGPPQADADIGSGGYEGPGYGPNSTGPMTGNERMDNVRDPSYFESQMGYYGGGAAPGMLGFGRQNDYAENAGAMVPSFMGKVGGEVSEHGLDVAKSVGKGIVTAGAYALGGPALGLPVTGMIGYMDDGVKGAVTNMGMGVVDQTGILGKTLGNAFGDGAGIVGSMVARQGIQNALDSIDNDVFSDKSPPADTVETDTEASLSIADAPMGIGGNESIAPQAGSARTPIEAAQIATNVGSVDVSYDNDWAVPQRGFGNRGVA